MRRKALIVALILGTAVFAQGPAKGKGTEKKEEKTEQKDKDKETEKGKPTDKQNPGQAKKDQTGKPEDKGKSENNGKDKEHPGQGNAYGKNKGELSGREFGQARAAAAKAKNEEVKPVTIEDAREEIRIVRERNIELLSDTERKLKEARVKIEELKKAGTITLDSYNQKIKAVEELLKKRATIELKVE